VRAKNGTLECRLGASVGSVNRPTARVALTNPLRVVDASVKEIVRTGRSGAGVRGRSQPGKSWLPPREWRVRCRRGQPRVVVGLKCAKRESNAPTADLLDGDEIQLDPRFVGVLSGGERTAPLGEGLWVVDAPDRVARIARASWPAARKA